MIKEDYRAVFYARVSTVHDSQAESITNQIALCESYLKRHPEIELVEPLDSYTERISGKTDVREKFQLLIERLGRGDIDYLMVKDLKRLSRSTEVSARLRNLSQEYGFKIILLSTSQIYDPNAGDTRMMYGFESLVNEEVVFRQSEYGRVAHRQKCEAKRLNRNNVTFGYRWDEDKQDIVIDEEKAKIIKTLFDRYVFFNDGIKELRKYLSSLGLHYSSNTVRKWLQERDYIGDYCFNRKGSELSVGAGKKTRRYEKPKEEWVHVYRPDLAIVDKEVFDLAQEIRESRMEVYAPDVKGNVQARFKGTHLFSAKVYCGECGHSYIHRCADRSGKIHIYKDSFSMKNRNALEKCRNREFSRVYEEDLKKIILTVINGLIKEMGDIFPLLEEAFDRAIWESVDHNVQITTKEEEREHLMEQAEKVQDAFIDASKEMREGLNGRLSRLNVQIMQLEDEIKELKTHGVDEQKIKKKIRDIKDEVGRWTYIDSSMLNRKVVETFIHKIIIHGNGSVDVHLNANRVQRYAIPVKSHDKKEDSDEGPLFWWEEGKFCYGAEMYFAEMEKIVEEVLLGSAVKGTDITLMTFVVEERCFGSDKKVRKDHRMLQVRVCIYISRD